MKLPEEISVKMQAWRDGMSRQIPKEYIEFHFDYASQELKKMLQDGHLILHRTYLDYDGWGDGMKVLWAIVEEPDGTLKKLRWNDGSECFFEKSSNGGSFPYHLEKRYIYQVVTMNGGVKEFTFEQLQKNFAFTSYLCTGMLKKQPRIQGLVGPMWGGRKRDTIFIRYEDQAAYDMYSR